MFPFNSRLFRGNNSDGCTAFALHEFVGTDNLFKLFGGKSLTSLLPFNN